VSCERCLATRPFAAAVALAASLTLMLAGEQTTLAEDARVGGGAQQLDAGWAQTLAAYGANPRRQRRALLKAAEEAGDDDLPTPVVLALADARMRGGNFHLAKELCDRVIERRPEEPWIGWATLGSAWAGIAIGADEASARQLDLLADSNSQSKVLASFVLALVDGAHGHFERAQYGFERASSAAVTDALRAAARFGVGLVSYWKGEYDAAIADFRGLAVEFPGSAMVDDARYGAARAELQRGNRDVAVVQLRELATLPRRGVRVRYSTSLVNLDPSAILRAGTERYRRSRARMPEAQAAAALDSDGGSLARALLRALGEAPAPGELARNAAAAPEDGLRVASDAARDGARRRHEAEMPLSAFVALAATLVLVIGGVVAWWRASRGPRTRPR